MVLTENPDASQRGVRIYTLLKGYKRKLYHCMYMALHGTNAQSRRQFVSLSLVKLVCFMEEVCRHVEKGCCE